MSVRLPGLLSPNLTERSRLRPTAGSLTVKMVGSSEAVLTLPEDEADIQIHDWVSVYTEEGPAGLFRVTNVAQPLKKQVDVTLLHGIDILSDSVWAEQTEFSGTKEAFLRALLNQQTQLINGQRPWVLGVCEDTATVRRDINYDRLSTLLEGLNEDGGNYWFTYDMTVFPWVLNYVRVDDTVVSEFRLTRNIRSATVTYNDADLCTRLFLTVSTKTEETVPTKKMNPAYVSDQATPNVPRIITENITVSSVDSRIKQYNNTAAQGDWGIVVKTADIDTTDDILNGHFESADAWAAAFMARRSAPSVQIQIDGDDLFALTGDTWDRTKVGRLCQVALPAYGKAFRERVVSVTYPELFKKPDEMPRPTHVTVSLSNILPRFSESLAQAEKEAASASRSSRSTARAQTREEKELTTWSQHVQWQGAALDGSGIMTLYESGIDMDATGGVKIYSLENGLQGLYGELVVQSRLIAGKVGSDALNGYLKITDLTTEMGNVMEGANGKTVAAKIVTAINAREGTGVVKIEADQVDITGLVTMTQLEAVEGKIDTVRAETITAGTYLSAATGKFNTLWVESPGSNGATHTAQVNNAVNGLYEYTPAEEGKIGFQYTTLANPTKQSINFNIADTAYFQQRVGIASLIVDVTDQAGYNDSSADTVSVAADGYYIIAATPKHGNPIYKKFHAPAGTTTTPKVSKGSWSSGQIMISASSAASDPVSSTIKIKGGNTTGSLDSATSPTKISFDVLEDLGNNQTADTGVDIVATVARGAATVKLGTYNSDPAIVADTVGYVTVGGQRIQVGVTPLAVTPGTATPNTPAWNSSTHKYAITADGSVTIGSSSLALNQGSISGGFSPTQAFTYGFNLCFNSVTLTASKLELNPGETVDVIPNMKGTWDAAQTQNFSGKKITISAKAATTVNVDKGSWSSGAISFSTNPASGTGKNVTLGFTVPANTSNGNVQITVVDKASPGSASQPLSTGLVKTLTLTCGDDYATVTDGSTTVARVPNNKSVTPVTVNVDKGNWSGGAIAFTTNPASGTGKNVSLGFTIPANTSNGNVQITVVDKASPGSASYPVSTGLTKTLTLTCGDTYATVTDGGTTVAQVPNNKSVPASSASIDSIGLRNAGGVQYVYDPDDKEYAVYVRATGTNVAQKDGTVYISASEAFIAGRDSVTITNVERIASCAFDPDARTARQDVRFTLSNGNTFVIHENFDAIYRAGMNGTSVDTTIEYAADLSSEGVVFDADVDEDAQGNPLRINLSDIYQRGVTDAIPPETHWYVTGSGATVPIYNYVPIIGDQGVPMQSTKVAFYTYTPVEIVGVLSGNLAGYTQVSYNGTKYIVLSSNLTESAEDLSAGHRIGIKDLTVTRTGVTMTGIYHRGTKNVTITVHRDGASSPTTVTSYYASQRDFDALVTNGSAGTYFNYLSYLSGYYASHEASVYDDTLTHKAVFEETYSDGSTVTVIVAFDSYNYAAAPVRLSWEIVNYYNNQEMSIPVSFYTADNQYLTMSYTSGYNSQVVDQSKSVSTYIRGDVTYAYNKNYPSTMTCRFRVRWHLSDGSTEDVIVQKTASRAAAPVTQKLYVYASNGGAVRFRKAATTSSQTWGSLVPNTPVTYESGPSSSGWYTVTYDGKTGYIMSEYISETATSPTNYSYIGWLKSAATTYIKGVYRNGYTGTGKVSIVYNNGSVQSFNVYSSAAQVNNISGHDGSVASTAKEAWSVDTRLIGYYLYIVYTDGTSTYLVVKDSNEE